MQNVVTNTLEQCKKETAKHEIIKNLKNNTQKTNKTNN